MADEFRTQIRKLQAMCAGYSIRPLVSKWNGAISFEACAGVIKGKKIRKTFSPIQWATIEEAFVQAKRWLGVKGEEIKSDRSVVLTVPDYIRPQLAYVLGMCETKGYEFLQVCDAGLKALDLLNDLNSVTFFEASEKVISQKKNENLSPIYLRDLERVYKLFGETFSEVLLKDITADDIEEWLSDFEIGPVSWNNIRRMLVVLWNVALLPRYKWVKENTAEQVVMKKVDAKDVSILTLEDAAAILRNAQLETPRAIPYLCLGMFAGLRISEAKKAQWEDIDWERRTIKVKGKVRSMASRYVDLEEVFVDWMKPIAQASGPLCSLPDARRADISKLRKLVGHFDSNVFRHSYGSYHWGAFQNPNRTMAEMGHASLQMLYKYYRKPLPQKMAAPFWELTRSKVLSA